VQNKPYKVLTFPNYKLSKTIMILNLNTLHYLSEIYIDIPDEECIKTERKQFFTIND